MFFKGMTEEEKAEQTVGLLTGLLKIDLVEDEIRFTIREVEKVIPKELICKPWNPNRCPTCGADLGGECNDGYYENPRYDHCPNCRQVLKYD